MMFAYMQEEITHTAHISQHPAAHTQSLSQPLILWCCEGQSYNTKFNYCASEIHETKMPLTCKPPTPGQTVTGRLEDIFGRLTTHISIPLNKFVGPIFMDMLDHM